MSEELVAILSVGVALTTIQLAIAGLLISLLNRSEQRTDARNRERIEELEKRLVQRMDASEARLGERMDRLEQRMDGIEQRMDGIEERMDGIEQRMEAQEGRIGQRMEAQESRIQQQLEAQESRIQQQLEAQNNRIQSVEAHMHNIDKQLARIGGLLDGLREAIVQRATRD